MLKKRLFCSVIALVLSFQAAAFSQSITTETPPEFTLEQKIKMYQEAKASTEIPALLTLVPFGVGSFSQGDLSAGSALLGVDLLTAGALALAFNNNRSGYAGIGAISLAITLYLTSRVFGLIHVSQGVEAHNTELLKKLDLDKSLLPDTSQDSQKFVDENSWTESLNDFCCSAD